MKSSKQASKVSGLNGMLVDTPDVICPLSPEWIYPLKSLECALAVVIYTEALAERLTSEPLPLVTGLEYPRSRDGPGAVSGPCTYLAITDY